MSEPVSDLWTPANELEMKVSVKTCNSQMSRVRTCFHTFLTWVWFWDSHWISLTKHKKILQLEFKSFYFDRETLLGKECLFSDIDLMPFRGFFKDWRDKQRVKGARLNVEMWECRRQEKRGVWKSPTWNKTKPSWFQEDRKIVTLVTNMSS